LVVDGVANADDKAADQCRVNGEGCSQGHSQLSLNVSDYLLLIILRERDCRREDGFVTAGELVGKTPGGVSDFRNNAESAVPSQHMQGMACRRLHAAGGNAVDHGILLIQGHPRRVKDKPRVWHLGQHFGGECLQFLENLIATALSVGCLENRLSVDAGNLLRSGVETIRCGITVGCCVGHGFGVAMEK